MPFVPDDWVLFLKKQKKLKSIFVIRIGHCTNRLLEKEPYIFDDLEKLHLSLGSRTEMKAGQKLLAGTRKIQELSIDTTDATADDEDLWDSGTELGLVSQTLFSHLIPIENCPPLTLKSLELTGMSIEVSAYSNEYMSIG